MEQNTPGSVKPWKKLFAILVIIIAGFLVWRYFLPLKNFYSKLPTLIKNSYPSAALSEIQHIGEQVFTPPPLKGSTTPKNQAPALTRAGIIAWTNINRKNNGSLAALKENAKLDLAAQNKLNDMFKQQYFEHINPQGRGPSNLSQDVGYSYITIGENLALGFFDNDQDLLEAWMNSPGHRANILNIQYEEMGAAVGKGMYEGKETWMAVQEFGRPQSSCPIVDSNLKASLITQQAEVNAMQSQLAAAKADIDSQNPKTQQEYDAYNTKVAEYNNLIKIYNNKVDVLKMDTSQYNGEVNAYNACLGS